MAKITGRIEVVVDGVALLNKSGATLSGIGKSGKPAYERKVVMGDSGVHGYIEEPIVPACEVTITDRDDISLSDLASTEIGAVTVIFRAAGGGKVYTGEGCTCTGNFTLTGGEGETTVRFEAPFWTETTSES